MIVCFAKHVYVAKKSLSMHYTLNLGILTKSLYSSGIISFFIFYPENFTYQCFIYTVTYEKHNKKSNPIFHDGTQCVFDYFDDLDLTLGTVSC